MPADPGESPGGDEQPVSQCTQPVINGIQRDDDSSPVSRRRFIVTTMIAILALVASAIPLYQLFKPSTPEEHVAQCARTHHLPVPPTPPDDYHDRSAIQYAGCSWPPVPGADSDGYYTIRINAYGIPNTANADP